MPCWCSTNNRHSRLKEPVIDGDSYAAFLERRTQLDGDHGFSPVWMPDFLFEFQASLVEWALRKGRAAIFADCGLGKTLSVLADTASGSS